MGDEVRKGWGWPGASRKAHYFVGGRSLCLKWGFFGEVRESGPGPDDCAACKRAWTKTYVASTDDGTKQDGETPAGRPRHGQRGPHPQAAGGEVTGDWADDLANRIGYEYGLTDGPRRRMSSEFRRARREALAEERAACEEACAKVRRRQVDDHAYNAADACIDEIAARNLLSSDGGEKR